jgi:hypothetical protein
MHKYTFQTILQVVSLNPDVALSWGKRNTPPRDVPVCGYNGELCTEATKGIKKLAAFKSSLNVARFMIDH